MNTQPVIAARRNQKYLGSMDMPNSSRIASVRFLSGLDMISKRNPVLGVLHGLLPLGVPKTISWTSGGQGGRQAG